MPFAISSTSINVLSCHNRKMHLPNQHTTAREKLVLFYSCRKIGALIAATTTTSIHLSEMSVT